MKPAREKFVVTFEALPDDRPAVTRVRQLVKIAGRALRLRCTRLASAGGAEVAPESPAAAPAASSTTSTPA